MDRREGKDDHGEHHNDNMELNPNVQFGVNNIRDVQYQRSPNHESRIGNEGSSSREFTTAYQRHLLGHGTRSTVNSTSLSHGTMGNQRDVLGQSVDGTQPVVNTMSSSLGTTSNQRNVLGPSVEGTGPVMNAMSSSLGTLTNQRNLAGQSVDGTQPVVNAMSSSLGTMLNQRDVLGQSVHGTRPVVNSVSSSHGTASNQRILLGQSVNGTRPVLNSTSLSHGTMSNQRNVLGQSVDGTQPVVNAMSSSVGTRENPIVVSDQSDIRTQGMSSVIRQPLSSSGVNRVMVSTQGDNTHTTRTTSNQILDPIQLLNNMSYPLPPYVPRNRSRPYIPVITRGPPSAILVPPRVEIHPPMVLIPPPTDSIRISVIQMVPRMVQMRPPVVQNVPPMVHTESQPGIVSGPVNPSTNINMGVRPSGEHGGRIQNVPPMIEMRPPAVEMRPPMVQRESQRGFVSGPARPSTNINMSVRPSGEHGGRIQQRSHSDEAISQRRRSPDDEPESSSRDAKRFRR